MSDNDWGDFPPSPDWDDSSDFPEIPDDFFGDSLLYDTPDIDSIVWGDVNFDDEDRLLDIVLSGTSQVGEDIDWYSSEEQETIDNALASDDDDHFDDDWQPSDDLDFDSLDDDYYPPYTGEHPEEQYRGPFPDDISAYDYIQRLGAVGWFAGIEYDIERGIYYVYIEYVSAR